MLLYHHAKHYIIFKIRVSFKMSERPAKELSFEGLISQPKRTKTSFVEIRHEFEKQITDQLKQISTSLVAIASLLDEPAIKVNHLLSTSITLPIRTPDIV